MNHETTRNNTMQSPRNIMTSFVSFRVVSRFNFSARRACTFRSKHWMFVALAACLLLIAARVSAQRQASNDLNAPVEPGAKATDLDLIRMVLPDAVENDEGAAGAHKTIDLRDLFDHHEPGAYEVDIQPHRI